MELFPKLTRSFSYFQDRVAEERAKAEVIFQEMVAEGRAQAEKEFNDRVKSAR